MPAMTGDGEDDDDGGDAGVGHCQRAPLLAQTAESLTDDICDGGAAGSWAVLLLLMY